MIITVRFNSQPEGNVDFIGGFLKSLKLNSRKRFEDQSFELRPMASFEIYKMSVPVPQELLTEAVWNCRLERQAASDQFLINGRVVGINLWDGNLAEEILRTLPEELKVLCLESLCVTDLSPLAKLVNLTGLNLSHCEALQDLGPLAGLVSPLKLEDYQLQPRRTQRHIF